MKTLLLFASVVFAIALPVAAQDPVTIRALPAPVYIETSRAGQHLNFDFAVKNSGAADISIRAIELSVYDRSGSLVLRKFIDGNGTAPSVQTVPERDVKAGTELMVFNPFHSFTAETELARLDYRFDVRETGKKADTSIRVSVRPVLYRSKTDLVLPLRGRMIVYDGHDFYSHHRRFNYLFQPIKEFGFTTNFMRYSYDLCPVNEKGEMFSGDEAKNENWFGFGDPIYAAGSGTVVAAIGTFLDDRNFPMDKLKTDQMVLFGNYLVIDHGSGEFSMFAHLRQNSLRFKVGDRVKQGEQIAEIGASGSANIPHLHYELRTGKDASAEGLPSYFRDFRRVLGAAGKAEKLGQIDSGDIIEGR